jgi:hypothetical protein
MLSVCVCPGPTGRSERKLPQDSGQIVVQGDTHHQQQHGNAATLLAFEPGI